MATYENASTSTNTSTGSSSSSIPATVMSTSFLSMGAATVIINIGVICLIVRYKWMRSHANLIICSMAGTDVVGGLVAMTVGVVKWTDWFPAPPALFCRFFFITNGWSVMASLAHVLAINVERYLAIVLPLRYKEYVSGPRVKVMVLCIWMITLAEAIAIAFVARLSEKCWLEHMTNLGVAFGLMTVGIVMPFISVVAIYIHITVVVIKKLHFMAQSSNVDEASLAQSQRKMFITVSAILASWVLSFLCVFFVFLSTGPSGAYVDMGQLVYVMPIVELLMYASSLLNPILYFITSADFRKAALLLLKCKSTVVSNEASNEASNGPSNGASSTTGESRT